jgi:hypothetical protein
MQLCQSISASRRSVLTRSPDFIGISEGATTLQLYPPASELCSTSGLGGLTPESQVRSGLTAGGNWIRTLRPAARPQAEAGVSVGRFVPYSPLKTGSNSRSHRRHPAFSPLSFHVRADSRSRKAITRSARRPTKVPESVRSRCRDHQEEFSATAMWKRSVRGGGALQT